MFTMIFDGNVRNFPHNPMMTETPFGVAIAVGIGSAFDEAELFRIAIERIADGEGNAMEIAQSALFKADAMLSSEIQNSNKAQADAE